jgi:hypothetical protein
MEGPGASVEESVPLSLTEPLTEADLEAASPDPEGDVDAEAGSADGLAALRVVETDGEGGSEADVVDEAVSPAPGDCVASIDIDAVPDKDAAERVDEIEGDGGADAEFVSLGGAEASLVADGELEPAERVVVMDGDAVTVLERETRSDDDWRRVAATDCEVVRVESRDCVNAGVSVAAGDGEGVGPREGEAASAMEPCR